MNIRKAIMSGIKGSEIVRDYSTRYLRDMLSNLYHVARMRALRGEKIPDILYQEPAFYPLRMEKEKIKGNGEVIYYPKSETQPDLELEIAAICLKDIREISNIDEAIRFARYDMAYALFNDTSCRDQQKRDMAKGLGPTNSKGLADKAFGDWVLGEELNSDGRIDLNGVLNMNIGLIINGKKRCITNFNNIYFIDPETQKQKCWSFPQFLFWSCKKMNQCFEAGDIIGSGTISNQYQSGCLAETNGPWLQEGDTIWMYTEVMKGFLPQLHNKVGFI